MSEHSRQRPIPRFIMLTMTKVIRPNRIECTDNPLIRQRAIYYTHSSLSGLPEALTNCEGEIVRQGNTVLGDIYSVKPAPPRF